MHPDLVRCNYCTNFRTDHSTIYRSVSDKQVILFASLVLSPAGKGNQMALSTNQLTPPSHLHRWALASALLSLAGMLEQRQDWPTCVSSKATMTQQLLADFLFSHRSCKSFLHWRGGQTVISASGLMDSHVSTLATCGLSLCLFIITDSHRTMGPVFVASAKRRSRTTSSCPTTTSADRKHTLELELVLPKSKPHDGDDDQGENSFAT